MQSKRALYFSCLFLMKNLGKKASASSSEFKREKGAQDVVDHYKRVHDDLKSLGGALKAAAETELKRKDDLAGPEKEIRNQRS